ncbi:hypothetical protein IW262DRAFT_1291662 [Armillaria fumosa]|nr:hypothetical protein IW262DRAFT_1291662 [Armillaria fumosa]
MLPTYAFTLGEMLARHDWALTFTHSPDVDSLFHTNNMPSPTQAVQIEASVDNLEGNSRANKGRSKLNVFLIRGGPWHLGQVMEQCFNVMMAHLAWWEIAEMMVPPLYIPRLDLLHRKIGWLKKMDLVCFDTSSLNSKSIHAFEIAPSLQVLHLRGMHPKANISFPTVNLISFSDDRPWSGDRMDPEYLGAVKSALKLRSFSYIDHVLDNNLPVILRLSPQLEEFSIGLFEKWMDEYDPVMRDLVTQMKETIMVEASPRHCLVPSLQQFTIRLLHISSSTLSFLDLNFVEMIAS